MLEAQSGGFCSPFFTGSSSRNMEGNAFRDFHAQPTGCVSGLARPVPMMFRPRQDMTLWSPLGPPKVELPPPFFPGNTPGGLANNFSIPYLLGERRNEHEQHHMSLPGFAPSLPAGRTPHAVAAAITRIPTPTPIANPNPNPITVAASSSVADQDRSSLGLRLSPDSYYHPLFAGTSDERSFLEPPQKKQKSSISPSEQRENKTNCKSKHHLNIAARGDMESRSCSEGCSPNASELQVDRVVDEVVDQASSSDEDRTSLSEDDKADDRVTLSPHGSTPEKYPDYCQTILVKDSNGQVKEMVFPKGLDLDRPKRARTTFSQDQLFALEREFQRNQYLVGRERTDLAQSMQLSETQVKVWFQNRRTKCKRDKSRESELQTAGAESAATCSILNLFQPRQTTSGTLPSHILGPSKAPPVFSGVHPFRA